MPKYAHAAGGEGNYFSRQAMKSAVAASSVIKTGLRDKVIIVTGASSGIGKATAHRFSEEGCRVACWDIKDGHHENGIFFQKVDVSSTESVEAAVKELVSLWKSPDVLINNAGILNDAQLVKYKDSAVQHRMTDEQFDSVISINLRGVFTCTRAVSPYMIEAGGGVILSAASVVGLYGNFGQTNYVASKAGVIGLTRVWARELGRHNIRVNVVAPGFIATEMTRKMPEKVLNNMRDRTPLQRMGRAEDIANAYLWLASDAAAFVNGAVINVDGGLIPGT